ncbi:MAG: hypothetical protein WAZ36_09785 [Sediminibacterium sp.]
MKEFQLSCSFDAFKDTVQTQIEKFEVLQQRQINNIEELQTARQERWDCYREAITNLNHCFMEENNELVRDFTETQATGFQIVGARKSTEAEIKEFRESCKNYISSLNCQQ